MTKERAMELLDMVIDYVSITENISTTIQELLHIGFTEEELVNEFHFSQADIDNLGSEEDEE